MSARTFWIGYAVVLVIACVWAWWLARTGVGTGVGSDTEWGE